MSKAVLISIQPKWCELIASGKKTVEVRKTKPKLETPFKVYIYCTKDEPMYRSGEKFWCKTVGDFGNGKVIGEFVCDRIDYVRNYGDCVDSYDCIASCLSANEIIEYAKDKDGNFIYTYGWHISNLVIYDKPKELSAFRRACPDNVYSCAMCRHGNFTGMKCTPIKRPPQSWCYVEERSRQ